MIFNERALNNNRQLLTEEEMLEARRQKGMLGVKLTGRKFYCLEKTAAGFGNFFHGRRQFGSIGVDEDGRHFVQVDSINLEIKSKLASLCSDKAWHIFLSACYDQVVEIYAKRLEATAARVQADQDNSKKCQAEAEELRKGQTCRSSDILLLQQQKTKKPQPRFDKGDLKTWCSLSFEDARESKGRLTEKKTRLLKKEDDIETQIPKFTTEMEAFQKEVDALEIKLNAALDELEYKNIRLSYDFNILQVKKLRKKIANNSEEKARLQAEREGLDKQVSVLECVIDSHQIAKDAENWENRRNRAVERVLRVLKDRSALNTLCKNLNQRWNDLTTEQLPKKEPRAVSPYRQDPPVKHDELCERLALKASAEVYFI